MKTKPNNEIEMREENPPLLETLEELNTYISSVIERGQLSYGSRTYAMSLAAIAALKYVTGQFIKSDGGVSESQIRYSISDLLRRLMEVKGPTVLLRAEDTLLPGYNLEDKLSDVKRLWPAWTVNECARLLETADEHTPPDLLAHWKKLTEGIKTN